MAHMLKIKLSELKLSESPFNGLPSAELDALKFKSGLFSPLISDEEKKFRNTHFKHMLLFSVGIHLTLVVALKE